LYKTPTARLACNIRAADVHGNGTGRYCAEGGMKK
jgi:hypothetical protein